MKIKKLGTILLVLDIIIFTAGMTSVASADNNEPVSPNQHIVCENNICRTVNNSTEKGDDTFTSPNEHIVCDDNICKKTDNPNAKGDDTFTSPNEHIVCDDNVCRTVNNGTGKVTKEVEKNEASEHPKVEKHVSKKVDENEKSENKEKSEKVMKKDEDEKNMNKEEKEEVKNCVNNVCTEANADEPEKNEMVNSVPEEMENNEGVGGGNISNNNTNTNSNTNTNTVNVVDQGAKSTVTDNKTAENESVENGKGGGTLPETGANPFVPGLAASLLASTVVWFKTRKFA